MPTTWMRSEVAEITGLSDRRVLFYTEQNVLPQFHVNVGRGTAREYSLRDIFYLMLLLELKALGLSLSRIKSIIMALHGKTFDDTNAPEWQRASGPTIWVDGGFTREQVFLIISPHASEKHALSPESKGYDEDFLSFRAGSTNLESLHGQPSKIVVHLNRVFERVKL
jgi:DNA-binding transcriptional MerR regulator